MTDQCEPGTVWLCRDKWADKRSQVRVSFWRPKPRSVSIPDMWSGMSCDVKISQDNIEGLFGDIPEPNTAWLVTTKELEWWCPICRDYVCLGYGGFPACGHGDPVTTKSRCRVLETISLKEASDAEG